MTDDTLQCDVLVIGSGAAGMVAALAAAANGAEVILAERTPTVGGTSATSGGISWIPAHNRDPENPQPVEDALAYLAALSNGSQDPALVEVFVRSGPAMIDFVERETPLKYEIAKGYPDYKPEHPGGRPEGGRSLSPIPYRYSELGDWSARITAFPNDFSNVGFDAETRKRLNADVDGVDEIAVAGQALIARLLRGLLDRGIEPLTGWRGRHLIVEDGRVVGARFDTDAGERTIRAGRGVVLASGGFEWDPDLVRAFLRGPMFGPVSPPNNTGDALKMAQEVGAALGTMGEAWWVPVIKIPGDLIDGQVRSRSVRLERTRPRSIMVNRYGKRFVNEASDYNSMGGAFHQLDVTRFEYSNNPAWLVFDQTHLDKYGFLSVPPGGQALDWFNRSESLEELAAKTGVATEALLATVAEWNRHVAAGRDPEFLRGESSYDGYWGDPEATTRAGRTLGPLDTPPYYAIPVEAGSMGTKGGPRTDGNGQVLHVDGHAIPGLYAAGNAMASIMGMAYGGAGGTLGPGQVFGYRAGFHAATGQEAPYGI